MRGHRPSADFQRLEYGENFEHRIVEQILTHFNLAWAKKELIRAELTERDASQLTFLQFYRRFSSFPAWLFFRKDRLAADEMTLSKVLTDFGKCRAMSAFRDALADGAPDCYYGSILALAFHWPRLPGGVILHNGWIQPQNGTQLLYQHGEELYAVERLKQFLDRLEWDPNG